MIECSLLFTLFFLLLFWWWFVVVVVHHHNEMMSFGTLDGRGHRQHTSIHSQGNFIRQGILQQYAQAMDAFGEESECRVCRDTATESEPLLSPCKCDGSIKFVHESCLLRWLSVKKIDSCELCGHRFVFASVYSDDAPERLPWHEFMRLSLQMVASRYQTFLKVVYCIFLWLLLLPVLVKWGFAIWEQEKYSFAVAHERMTVQYIWEDAQHGIFLIATTTVVVLALVAFTDFYRWRTEDQAAINRAMRMEQQNLDDLELEEEEAEVADNDMNEEEEVALDEENDDGAVDDDPLPAMQGRDVQEVQPPVDENINDQANIDAGFGDDGGAEVQLPLTALLGLDSNPLVAFRNMAIFCFVVTFMLTIFVAFPRGVGRGMLLSIFSTTSTNQVIAGSLVTNTVHFFVGYGVIIGTLVGLPYFTATWVAQNFASEVAVNIGGYLSAVASVLKIMVLFVFKMGIYPMCLGLVWHSTELDCFNDSIYHEWKLMKNFPVTAGVAMHWVLGIGFMLIVTVIILELKEVLHPEVLNVSRKSHQERCPCFIN